MPRLVAPVTVHAAFHKAADCSDSCSTSCRWTPATGPTTPAAIEERLGDDVALVVLSAPSYPFATLDPDRRRRRHLRAAGIALHVDACIGGFALAFWPEELPAWDFAVPGVTSLSADLHKYGYAPEGRLGAADARPRSPAPPVLRDHRRGRATRSSTRR